MIQVVNVDKCYWRLLVTHALYISSDQSNSTSCHTAFTQSINFLFTTSKQYKSHHKLPQMETAPSSTNQPTRVVLRIAQRNSLDYNEIISSFLRYVGHPTSADEINKHWSHIQPPSETSSSYHITLDMNKDGANHNDLQSLPHEYYRVSQDEQKLL